jgi:hypothetical protein
MLPDILTPQASSDQGWTTAYSSQAVQSAVDSEDGDDMQPGYRTADR